MCEPHQNRLIKRKHGPDCRIITLQNISQTDCRIKVWIGWHMETRHYTAILFTAWIHLRAISLSFIHGICCRSKVAALMIKAIIFIYQSNYRIMLITLAWSSESKLQARFISCQASDNHWLKWNNSPQQCEAHHPDDLVAKGKFGTDFCCRDL